MYLSKRTRQSLHNMAYDHFKDESRRTASDKVLCDKAFNVAKNPKYNGYQRGLASIVYKYFDEKSAACCKGTGINSENQQLAEKIAQTNYWKI